MRHDWDKIKARMITVGDLIRLASGLKSEHGENPEYDRALAELVTDAAGLSMASSRGAAARKIGLKIRVV